MKMNKWQALKRIEKRYINSINTIFKQVEFLSQTTNDPTKLANMLKALSTNNYFNSMCEDVATRMVTHINREVGGTWKDAAIQVGRGNEIYKLLMKEISNPTLSLAISEKIQENARQIKSLPLTVANDLTDEIRKLTFQGKRSEEIANIVKAKSPNLAERYINTIARTEVSKTQSALVQVRAEELGLNWYIWRDSGDSRVRKSHGIMEGVLVNWKDPPNPELLEGVNHTYGNYHAGCIFNCRCYAEPVVSWNLVKFPCKVHVYGQIINMSKKEFMAIA